MERRKRYSSRGAGEFSRSGSSDTSCKGTTWSLPLRQRELLSLYDNEGLLCIPLIDVCLCLPILLGLVLVLLLCLPLLHHSSIPLTIVCLFRLKTLGNSS